VLLRRDWEFVFEQLKSTSAVIAYFDRVAGETVTLGNEFVRYYDLAQADAAEFDPNADRLRVCMVDTGNSAAPVQVVCGAPNARAGLVSVFSPPGTFIPGKNITLGIGTIRGVESRGMLCSAAELQISEDHDGIMELPADAPVGAGYAQWAGLGDPALEINLTPNRQEVVRLAGLDADEADDPDVIRAASRKLLADLECDAVLVTHGAEGMTLFEQDEVTTIPAVVREAYDSTGAGDTVAAVLALALASGRRIADAARLAGIAAGVVVAKAGTATVTAAELTDAYDAWVQGVGARSPQAVHVEQ